MNATILCVLPSHPGPGGIAPVKEGDEKGHSAISEIVTRDYNITIYLQAHPWSGLQETWPLSNQRDAEICHEGDGNSGCVH